MLKQCLVSQLYTKKLLHQWLAFSGPNSTISSLFQYLSELFRPEKSKDEFQDLSGPMGTLLNTQLLHTPICKQESS